MATKPSLKKKQKAYSKASKARKLRSTAEAAERNNYSGKISEKKATRMKKKATKLYAASKKAHNTSGMASAKDVANRAKYDAYKKKKKAAENKEPLNYGTPMNYSMKPGSREKDSPGAFRDTPINKYMGSPVNYGTESPMNDGHDKKRKLGTEGMTSDEKVAYYKKQSENMKKKKASSNKAPRGPQNVSAGGIKARASVKGRSEKNTDLLDVAKKGIKKIFG